ncbi:MAG: 50S ribosomal protein L31 [Spirochaetes bacterium GWF1_51_8]|nr:MAG: 50S ribosomal protein L31 [Spirochaetes bacterium GWF1_51_8]
MREGIHPKLYNTKVKCTCGEEFVIRAAVEQIHVEVCSKCHPFYSGQKRNIDRGGMVERFKKRYGIK